MDELYIGLMSGTSLDGIDAALVDLSDMQFKLLASHYQPYPDTIKNSLRRVIQEQQTTFTDLAKLDHQLAGLNAQAVNTLLNETQYSPDDINAIGYHGQTVFHEPEGQHPNTIQLGDPSALVEQTKISVVADFRRMDMAAGGQGAPLAPAFHQFLFRDPSQDRAILNIGGIANLTLLPADINQAITGFDTGPGNCLLDEWSQLHHNQAFDEGGRWAQQGKTNTNVLQDLLSDPYFAKAPPKSTGREYFHLDWLQQHSGLDSVSPQDVQATLASLTVISISNALQQYAPNTRQVFVCGGGAHNQYLMSLLQKQLEQTQLASTAELGLDPDWVEACAFAWLAQQRMEHQTANIPSVTGASRPVLLGAIYNP